MDELAAQILANGGITYNPSTNSKPSKGYAVSPYKEHERVFPAPRFCDRNIRQYLGQRKQVFADQRCCLGAWVDEGKVYLDCSVVVDSAEEAENLCREHKQIAYFDLARFETVRI